MTTESKYGDEFDVQAGEVLAAARTELGVSLRGLETMTGMAFIKLRRIEAGTRRCLAREMLMLADFYRVGYDVMGKAMLGQKTARRELMAAARRKRSSPAVVAEYARVAAGRDSAYAGRRASAAARKSGADVTDAE